MIIIVDKRIPEPAKAKLSFYGEVIDFETKGIVYDSISCHPDIFFCQTPDKLIVAPDCPQKYIKLLVDRDIIFEIGTSKLGNAYPATARYNAVASGKFLVHNTKHTDSKIIEGYQKSGEEVIINVKQAYTRCNLIVINDLLITSDMGIFIKLKSYNLNTFYVNPEAVFLDGHKHGFFGGCCGTIDDKLFIIGSLHYISESNKLTDILTRNNIQLIELVDGQPFDGGGILFLEN